MRCSDLPGLLRGVLAVGVLVLGGLFTSIFSCTLLAELAVGRIIRAKNPSSRALEPTLLVRDFGLSLLPGEASDAREGCRGTLEGLVEETRGDAPVVSFLRVDGFRLRPEGVCARLGGRETDPALAAEEAVGAVMEAGRRTGRVGDFE